MNDKFTKEVDRILSENSDIFKSACEKRREIQNKKKQIEDLELEMQSKIDLCNGALGAKIRKHKPQLSCILSDGILVIKYKDFNNKLHLCPDLDHDRWEITGDSSFERRFKKYHGSSLTSDIDELAKEIAICFAEQYRTLR